MTRKLASLMCLAALIAPAHAETTVLNPTTVALQLFGSACVAQLGTPLKAHEDWATAQKLPRLDAKIEQSLLQGDEGSAWVANNQVGEYLLIYGSQIECSVFAHQVDLMRIAADFQRLVAENPDPAVEVVRQKDQSIAVSGGTTTIISYFVAPKAEKRGYLFTLATNPADKEAQARLSVSATSIK